MKKKKYKFEYQNHLKNAIAATITKMMKEMIREQWTHEQFLKIKSEKVFDDRWKELAKYNQQYLFGYMDALYNQIWYEHIEWNLYHPKHGLLSVMEFEKRNLLHSEVASKACAYVWKGTKNVFFRSLEQ
jgi:hypothetical protein